VILSFGLAIEEGRYETRGDFKSHLVSPGTLKKLFHSCACGEAVVLIYSIDRATNIQGMDSPLIAFLGNSSRILSLQHHHDTRRSDDMNLTITSLVTRPPKPQILFQHHAASIIILTPKNGHLSHNPHITLKPEKELPIIEVTLRGTN